MPEDVLDEVLNAEATHPDEQPGDVAVVQQTPSMHDPDAIEELGIPQAQIQFIDEDEARVEYELEECRHCMDGDAA